jgi:8-oxo-dGTP diphosphatase
MELIQKAVIENKGKYLILLRSEKAPYFPLHWDFPGGKLEPNEDPFLGIIREVKEETNLNIEPIKVLNVFNLDLDNKGKNTHSFSIYSTKIISGNIKLSFEHLEQKWATKEDILKLPIEPYIKLFFSALGKA